MERTIKTILVSIPAVKGYNRSVYRVVECRVDQSGYLNERGVRVIWQSSPLYRPKTKSGRGQGPEAFRQAKEIAARELLVALGV